MVDNVLGKYLIHEKLALPRSRFFAVGCCNHAAVGVRSPPLFVSLSQQGKVWLSATDFAALSLLREAL